VGETVPSELTDKVCSGPSRCGSATAWTEGVDLGPIVNDRQLRRVHSYTEVGVGEGER
jgi:hypothetical protein